MGKIEIDYIVRQINLGFQQVQRDPSITVNADNVSLIVNKIADIVTSNLDSPTGRILTRDQGLLPESDDYQAARMAAVNDIVGGFRVSVTKDKGTAKAQNPKLVNDIITTPGPDTPETPPQAPSSSMNPPGAPAPASDNSGLLLFLVIALVVLAL